jgi:hypothetical protein
MSHIPAVDDEETNRFYEDGEGLMRFPGDLPEKFATIEDFGTTVRTRASGKNEQGEPMEGGVQELKASYVLRIGTHSKVLTRKLARSYLADIERDFSRSCGLGWIGDWELESQSFASADGGLRLWTGQLTLTIHGRRPWQTLPAQVA